LDCCIFECGLLVRCLPLSPSATVALRTGDLGGCFLLIFMPSGGPRPKWATVAFAEHDAEPLVEAAPMSF